MLKMLFELLEYFKLYTPVVQMFHQENLCRPLANKKKGRKELKWEAWNLFQITSDGTRHFNVTEP